jgi:thiamine-phosphate pyrophosphorylase
VTDRSVSRLPLTQAVAAAVAGGVDQVQIREQGLGAAALLALAEELAHAAREAARAGGRSVTIVVNRRLDVALALGNAGVHLGTGAVTVGDARRLLGPSLPVGVSAHAPAEVEAAARTAASYAFLAPIFAPRSKAATRPALGLAALAEAARARLPVLAQGGCDATNAAALVAAGAAGLAVTGAILMAEDPGAAAARIRHALDAAGATPPAA